MPVASRLSSFEDWSKERGLVARDVDRRRVARELLELAEGGLVDDEHIETLTKRYRDGLMGARSVLAARRVAQELLEWQDEAGPGPEPAPKAEPEPERGREPGYEDEPEPEEEAIPAVFMREPPQRSKPREEPVSRRPAPISSYPPPDRGPPASDVGWPLDLPPARSDRPPARAAPQSQRAPAHSDRSPPVRSERPAAYSDRPAPSARPPRDPFSDRPAPSARPPRDPFSDRPPPPRSERPPTRPSPSDALSWRPSRLEEEARDAARRGVPSRRPAAIDPEETPLVPAVFEDRVSRPSSSRPGSSRRPPIEEERRSGRPSAPGSRPAAQHEAPHRSVRPSRRPLDDDDDAFELDDAPKRHKAGFSKPPSIRAPAQGLPELERDPGDVDPERKLRARSEIDEDNVAPPPDPRLSERPPVNLPPMMPELVPEPASGARRVLVMVGVAIALCLALLAITRPAILFSSNSKRVPAGTFVSKHLGLAWEFPESWIHAERLDDTETVPGGWKRKVSVFYHGTSPNAFQNQFIIVVFEKDTPPATDDDARQLGANEVIQASRRQCDTMLYHGIKATRCLAMAARPGQPLGVIETSFLLDGRAIFLRFSYELQMPGGAQNPQEAEQEANMLQDKLMNQLMNSDKLAASLRSLAR